MASSFEMTIIFLPDRRCSACCVRPSSINLTVIADYLIEPGRINGTAIRVALIRDTAPGLQEFIALLARSMTRLENHVRAGVARR